MVDTLDLKSSDCNGRTGSSPVPSTKASNYVWSFFILKPLENVFIYIIYSAKLNRYYVGTTDDVNKRLLEHNTGFYEETYVVKGIPWTLVLFYSCESSDKAYKLKKFIEKMKSRKFIEKIIDNFLILDDIYYKL